MRGHCRRLNDCARPLGQLSYASYSFSPADQSIRMQKGATRMQDAMQAQLVGILEQYKAPLSQTLQERLNLPPETAEQVVGVVADFARDNLPAIMQQLAGSAAGGSTEEQKGLLGKLFG
jgi:hypothetical protein